MSYLPDVEAERKPAVRRHAKSGVERPVQRPTSPDASRRARLWLAAANGQNLNRPIIAPIDQPETVMTVQFEGLSDEEQQAALAAFPGGRRFVLAS